MAWVFRTVIRSPCSRHRSAVSRSVASASAAAMILYTSAAASTSHLGFCTPGDWIHVEFGTSGTLTRTWDTLGPIRIVPVPNPEKHIGMVWEAYHKGVPLLEVPNHPWLQGRMVWVWIFFYGFIGIICLFGEGGSAQRIFVWGTI